LERGDRPERTQVLIHRLDPPWHRGGSGFIGSAPHIFDGCNDTLLDLHLPEPLRPALRPVLETIASLSAQIREYDAKLESVAKELYPETRLLRQVKGVGLLTALAFILTIEDPSRFEVSRTVGAYLGLVPSKDQSGGCNPQKHISKRGDELLRKLLVSCAHYVLGPFGQDSDLRRHGLKIAGRGGKNAKRHVVVAVARKLAVLLHRPWATGEAYEPLYNANRFGGQAA
jgi:transposase